MTAAILSIGTELTRGEVVNTNATWLAERLTLRGFEVTEQRVVADHATAIAEALSSLGERHQLVVLSGGLGPTTDDITTALVAQVAGQELVVHQPSLERIVLRLSRLGRTLSASNAKQAMIPSGATVLPNDCGMAPGYHCRLGGARLIVLPGVPSEMQAMFENHALPLLGEPGGEQVEQLLLRTFGVPESTLNDLLEGIAPDYDVELGYCLRHPEVDVKILARGMQPLEAKVRCRRAADAVRERLKDGVFGEGATTLAESVGEMLLGRQLTLGLAESCTGGGIASLLTQVSGASQWFCGGVVAYANSVKEKLLGVPAAMIAAHGAVSEEVACAMARGALLHLGCDMALSVSGICGPSGGTPTKPVGTVHFAVVTPGAGHHACHLLTGDRVAMQRRAAFTGLSLIRKVLSHPTTSLRA